MTISYPTGAGYMDGSPSEPPGSTATNIFAKPDPNKKWAREEFGSTQPGQIAKSLVLEDLRKYRAAPETAGLSEGEKQAAADKAAAASGAAMATGLKKGTREMMGGGTTGYASQALRESTAPTRQAAASASQQATEASRRMIEQKGENLYRSLTGQPAVPSLGQQMLAAGGTAALTAGGTALGEYVGDWLGEPAVDTSGVQFADYDPNTGQRLVGTSSDVPLPTA